MQEDKPAVEALVTNVPMVTSASDAADAPDASLATKTTPPSLAQYVSEAVSVPMATLLAPTYIPSFSTR